MKPQEKKYRVSSFDPIRGLLHHKHAPIIKTVDSTHYYGEHSGNDVEKFVEYPDRYEIHILKEHNGMFTLTEHARIPDKHAGFSWLKKKGYSKANIVSMHYTEYSYKNGTIGLYTINKILLSVILYYLQTDIDIIEHELGLQNCEIISVPYNIYVKRLKCDVSIQL